MAVAALASVGVLAASGCGSSPHHTAVSGTSTTSAGAGSATTMATGAAATATTAAADTTSTTSPQTGGAAPGSNVVGPTPGGTQPGGDPASRAYLANKGWINAGGQVVAQGFNLNGNGQSDDQAFCSYVFGTSAQIAQVTKVASTPVAFDDSDSGTQGDGTILCAYTFPGQSTDVVGLGVGNTSSLKSTASGGKDLTTIPATKGNEILFAYGPQYAGPTVAPAAASAWLQAALARIDFAGLTNS